MSSVAQRLEGGSLLSLHQSSFLLMRKCTTDVRSNVSVAAAARRCLLGSAHSDISPRANGLQVAARSNVLRICSIRPRCDDEADDECQNK